MSKVMGIYVKFTKTTHQIWSCHVTVASNSKNFNFSPNSVANFRKSYQLWGKLAQERKVTGIKRIRGWKTPSPPMLIGLRQIDYVKGDCSTAKLLCFPFVIRDFYDL